VVRRTKKRGMQKTLLKNSLGKKRPYLSDLAQAIALFSQVTSRSGSHDIGFNVGFKIEKVRPLFSFLMSIPVIFRRWFIATVDFGAKPGPVAMAWKCCLERAFSFGCVLTRVIYLFLAWIFGVLYATFCYFIRFDTGVVPC